MGSRLLWARILTTPHKEKCEVRGYKSHQVPYIWDKVKPYIQKALDRGSNYTIEEIYGGLLAAEMQLWVWQGGCKPEIYAALVTTIQNKDDLRWCLFLAIGGTRMDDWLQFLPDIEAWAKDKGCDEMRVYGRLPWARKLRAFDYKAHWVKLSKRL